MMLDISVSIQTRDISTCSRKNKTEQTEIIGHTGVLTSQ